MGGFPLWLKYLLNSFSQLTSSAYHMFARNRHWDKIFVRVCGGECVYAYVY